jgi:hypothetical protein
MSFEVDPGMVFSISVYRAMIRILTNNDLGLCLVGYDAES